MKVKIINGTANRSTSFLVDVPDEVMADKMALAIYEEVIRKVSDKIAQKFIAKDGQKVYKALDPQAIANLTVAEAGRSIKEMLDKKLPDKIVEVVKKEVYQRGIFGGIRRIG